MIEIKSNLWKIGNNIHRNSFKDFTIHRHFKLQYPSIRPGDFVEYGGFGETSLGQNWYMNILGEMFFKRG